MNTEKIRSHISFLRDMQKYCRENNLNENTKAMKDYKRTIRKDLKSCRDPLAKSMSEEWRKFYPREDGECWSEYIIFEDNGETVEEILEALHDMRREIHSPYDCSGQPFTVSMHWSRQPAGIVVIHRLALDV